MDMMFYVVAGISNFPSIVPAIILSVARAILLHTVQHMCYSTSRMSALANRTKTVWAYIEARSGNNLEVWYVSGPR